MGRQNRKLIKNMEEYAKKEKWYSYFKITNQKIW